MLSLGKSEIFLRMFRGRHDKIPHTEGDILEPAENTYIILASPPKGHPVLKSTFRIAEWKIQPHLNSATRGDHSVHLEPKVMQVLVQLASHPNEVISKDQLIQAVWPGTFVGD